MINIEEDKIIILGKISIYVIDKDNKIVHHDFAIVKPEKFEEEVSYIIESINNSPKIRNQKQITSEECEFDIVDTEYKLKVILGCCMMKEKEYDRVISYRCAGALQNRMIREKD